MSLQTPQRLLELIIRQTRADLPVCRLDMMLLTIRCEAPANALLRAICTSLMVGKSKKRGALLYDVQA